jgi:type IV pilus assembly protein PilV
MKPTLIFQRTAPPCATAGFTLIEVMVAILVLSIGLLGLAFLQGTGHSFNTDAYARTQATMLAYDIVDRMRANDKGFEDPGLPYKVDTQSKAAEAREAYDSCKASTCACDTAACNVLQLATYDIGQWYALQSALMPLDTGNLSTIDIDDTVVTITLRWREKDVLRVQNWDIEL